ncbi:MAG: hypothetical protein K0Q43_174 [Ramlibacter sp.]|nr:hypothetical protein [Ramlibacter sp.]
MSTSSVLHIAQHLAALPYAARIRVFGSVARAAPAPKDLDVFVDLRGEGAPNPADYDRLLLLSRIYYGELDPFLITDEGLLVRDTHARNWVRAKRARELLATMKREGRPLAEVMGTPAQAAPPADESPRRLLQRQAAQLGLPASAKTEWLANAVRAATSHPRTWTSADWRVLAPHLCLHQDLRPGSSERVARVLHEGLASGMVDSVSQILTGGWSWCGGSLSGVDTYLFIAGALRYRGATDPHLAPGNKPLCHFLPGKGTGAATLYQAVVETARTIDDALEVDREEAVDDVGSTPQPRG